MKSNPFDWLIKWILALAFGPPLLCLVLQILMAWLVQLLPILILLMAIGGLAGGVGAALTSGGRSAPRRIGGSYGPPLRSPFSSREQNFR